jgi:hypothetical protein
MVEFGSGRFRVLRRSMGNPTVYRLPARQLEGGGPNDQRTKRFAFSGFQKSPIKR